MRICHIVEAGGGVGNVLIDLARLGRDAGDDVTVIYAPARAWPNFLKAFAEMKGVRTIPVPMKRAVGPHDFIDCLRLYVALRRAGPFDVLHAHSSKAGALMRLLRWFFPKQVVIYTPHAFITMGPRASRLYYWIESLLSHFCDAIVCVSEQEKRHAVEQLKISARKLHVIPNGVDLNYPYDRAAARMQIGAKNSDFIVGFVGRLVPQKNPVRAIEAFAVAAKQRPALRLAIIGEGELQHETEDAIAVRGIKDRVRFVRDLNGRGLMAGFDCLLCSSDYESFGLVILEALAAGVPVVTTPVGIAEEAVVSGKTGTVAVEFLAQPLTDGLLALADCTVEERRTIARDARARAEDFSLERMGRSTRELYQKLLAQKGRQI